MRAADHLRVRRLVPRLGLPYYHHGICVSAKSVVHFSGNLENKRGASIRRAELDEFAEGECVEVVPYQQALPSDEVLFRAESCIGERDYNVVTNNCEHFAVWCKTGRFQSRQVDAVSVVAQIAAEPLALVVQIWADLSAIGTLTARQMQLARARKRLEREAAARETMELGRLKVELRRQLGRLKEKMSVRSHETERARCRLSKINRELVALADRANASLDELRDQLTEPVELGDDPLTFASQTSLFLVRQINELLAV